MKTLKIWEGGYENAENIRGGGYSLFNCFFFVFFFLGGGGKLCLSWAEGGGKEKYKLYRWGGSLYHCVTCGGGGIVCTGLYKMSEGGRYDVHNCGGGEG